MIDFIIGNIIIDYYTKTYTFYFFTKLEHYLIILDIFNYRNIILLLDNNKIIFYFY